METVSMHEMLVRGVCLYLVYPKKHPEDLLTPGSPYIPNWFVDEAEAEMFLGLINKQGHTPHAMVTLEIALNLQSGKPEQVVLR